MTRFIDGPAKGKTLMLRRAPLLLRVVIDRDSKVVDALDQLDDEPRLTEEIHVYRVKGTVGSCFISTRPRRAGGVYAIAEYEYYRDQPGESVRSRVAWRTWCRRQPEADLVQ
ncbi:MAG: hypothetical protein AAGI48_03970 [Verrucomicrobiota bacterium]